MDSTVSHDELSSKLKLAVLGVISTALAGKKGRIIQYPFQFFRITHNLNTVALMMKFCSTWALGQILHLRPSRTCTALLARGAAGRRRGGAGVRGARRLGRCEISS